MAAPMVTAAVGYLRSQPGWQDSTAAMARKAIRRCVDNTNLPTSLDKEFYGFGVLDFGKVAEAVLKGPTVFLS